jgi:hypothetical protein
MKKQNIEHICTDANKDLLGKTTPTPDMTNLGYVTVVSRLSLKIIIMKCVRRKWV